MENVEYKLILLSLASELKDMAGYVKGVDSCDSCYNRDFYEGVALAYCSALNSMKSILSSEDNVDLSDFGLDDFDPNEILDYEPRSSRLCFCMKRKVGSAMKLSGLKDSSVSSLIYMRNGDYGVLLHKVVLALRSNAEGLKDIDSKERGFNKDHFEGMAFAYHRVLDCVKRTIEFEEDLDLSDFDLEKYNPNDILFYEPRC